VFLLGLDSWGPSLNLDGPLSDGVRDHTSYDSAMACWGLTTRTAYVWMPFTLWSSTAPHIWSSNDGRRGVVLLRICGGALTVDRLVRSQRRRLSRRWTVHGYGTCRPKKNMGRTRSSHVAARVWLPGERQGYYVRVTGRRLRRHSGWLRCGRRRFLPQRYVLDVSERAWTAGSIVPDPRNRFIIAYLPDPRPDSATRGGRRR